MMFLKCLIIDDNLLNIQLIEKYIQISPELNHVGSENNPIKAAQMLIEGTIEADITFLDINMPGLGGLELAAMVNQITTIIFTTAHRQHGAEAYQLNAVDYLIKPITYQRFVEAVEKARKYVSTQITQNNFEHGIFINGDGKGTYIKLDLKEVIYIKGESNYVNFYLKERAYLSYSTLEKAERNMPAQKFVRVHKSYLVNLQHIIKVDTQTVYVSNGVELPIGRNYKDQLMKRILGS